jgi:hypothetical protein
VNQVNALGCDILSEVTEPHVQAQGFHLFDGFVGQQADLSVPGASMGIVLQPEAFHDGARPDILFPRPFLLADINGKNLSFLNLTHFTHLCIQ